MAGAEAKTQKRKSFGNQTPGKRIKLENGGVEGKSPKKPFIKKENGSPQKPGNFKGNKKNKGGEGAQKVKPFAGTKQLNDKPNKQVKGKKEKGQPETNAEKLAKKRRNNQFHKLKQQVSETKGQSKPELVKALDDKIKAIKSRDALTKTAKRKLGLLSKLKALAEGKPIEPKKPQEKQEGTAKARRDRKKRAAKEAKAAGKQKPAKQIKKEVESDDEDDDDAENGAEESSEEESGDEATVEGGEEDESDDDDDEDGGEEIEGEEADSDDDEAESGDDQDDDGDDDEDDEESDDAPAPKETPVVKKSKEFYKLKIQEDKKPKHKQDQEAQNRIKISKQEVNVETLKNKEIIGKGQKRYVLFVGNLPYDTTKEDLKTHFSKSCEILHIRIPLEKSTNRPRGFGYIEVKDEESYQKCLSMHHSQIKGRRINVLYTQGGKKNSENQKKEIKVKNMKLHALRKQGKLAGSTKESQKRAFRRKKGKPQENTDE